MTTPLAHISTKRDLNCVETQFH